MTAALLTRKHYTQPKGQSLIGDLSLVPARVHEFCGPSRRMLAVMLAAQMSGPIFWISPGWVRDQIYGPALVEMIDPARITLIRPIRSEDLLWAMEEVLRNGSVPLVIAELPEAPALTPVRRLHLAAERGGGLGLLLLAGDGGAQGAESRWHFSPRHSGEAREWILSRRRARMAPEAAWGVELEGKTPRLTTA